MAIQIHGFDSTGWFWHESPGNRPTGMLKKLSSAPGVFQGKFRCGVPGSPTCEFQTTVYDLGDSGLALVHLAGAPGGPVAALSAIPAHRRPRLRQDFAFGFVAHLGFLEGLVQPESELAVHDYIDNTLRTETSSTLVFTVEAAHTPADIGIVLSEYLERLAGDMLHWLRAKDGSKPFLVPAPARGRKIEAAV